MGALEDRFFATVFLGSGLLYVAMVFTSAALAGGLINMLINAPEVLSIGIIVWIPLVFPLWVFVLSVAILLQNLSGVQSQQ